MAAPTIEILPSFEPLALDEHISRWVVPPSSTSFSTSLSSTSASSFTDADCPSMFKTLTGSESLSSDTQTENETPPESPHEDPQATPVVVAHPFDHPSRPAFFSRVSIYSDLDDTSRPDAGYETECEDQQMRGPFAKRAALRRIPADRRRSEHQHRPRPDRLTTYSPSVRPQNPPSPVICPPKTELSPPSYPFPPAPKAPIGLGLGLGLPSTLSVMRRAPNSVSRLSADASPAEFIITPSLPVSTPTKPYLGPLSSPSAEGAMSPLDLPSPMILAPQPRHPAFSFAHNGGGHCGGVTTIAAIFALSQSLCPPSRCGTLPLQSTPEEEEPEGCGEEDAAGGTRRFSSEGLSYFPALGHRIISG